MPSNVRSWLSRRNGGRGPHLVDALGHAAAAAGGGVLVDGALGGDAVDALGELLELLLRRRRVALGDGRQQQLPLFPHLRLAGAVAGAALEVLADALLC